MNIIYRIIKEIPTQYRFKLVKIFLLIILTSCAEIVNIGAIYPVVSTLFNFGINADNTMYSKILYYIPYFHNFSSSSISLLIILIFICFSLVTAALKMYLLRSSINFSFSLGNKISSDIYHIILNKSYSFHVNSNSNEFIANIFHNTYSFIKTVNYFLNILSNAIVSFLILCFLFFVNALGTFILIISFFSMYLFISNFTKSKLYSFSLIESTEVASLIKLLSESFGSIREVIIRNMQLYYASEYKSKDMSLRVAQSKAEFYMNFPRFFMDPIAIIILVVLSFIISLSSNSPANNISILAIFVFSGQRLFPIFHQIYSSIAGVRANSSNVFNILNILESRTFSTHHVDKIDFINSIDLHCISYKYNNKFILKNASLKILKGHFIGLIGSTGVGKTTVFDLISFLLTPQSGYVSVDGVEINEFNAQSWQNKIAYVPQGIHLFDSSIAENIAIGVDLSLIDFKRLQYVCEVTCLNDFINSLPDKFLSQVGECGAQISGGQKQRIGLARALYNSNIEILLLDEPTSALDPSTENKIINSLINFNSNLTIIMITHRLETLKSCDYIYEIRDQKIHSVGRYLDL